MHFHKKKQLELSSAPNNKTLDTSATTESLSDNSKFLIRVMTIARKYKLDSQLSRFHYLLAELETITLSIHQLLVNYLQTSFTPSVELHCGQITASKCCQACRCLTANGSFVNQVIGISKIFSTEAMSC